MAEQSNLRDNSSRLRRHMSKLAYRSKEKVLRSFGRAEETKDEIFDHYVMLINKQQVQMQKLHRDMKQYLQALRAMSLTQSAFYASLYEIYDDDWAEKDVIGSCSQRSELLHEDIFARFQAEVIELLNNHLAEYQKCKLRVEKRGRKLVDYDAAKHSLQALESAKKPDEAKIEKAKEYANQARETYEELNSSLHEQLPSLYDSRLPVCVNVFSSICESEKVFSNEVSELRTKLDSVLQNLKSSFDNGEYHIQRMQPPLDNGRVAPVTTKDSPSVSTGSTAKIATTSTVSSTSPSQSRNEASVPPRSPDDQSRTSPSSDPSTHEYVNLQVGPVPGAVKPLSEEEETAPQSPKKLSDTKKTENEYLSPNVNNNREEIGYIMATDISSRRSGPVMVKPKPSPRSHVFRNPSDSQNIRPPFPRPKPLPRTLSAPPGERPVVKRQPKHPSLQGHWRVPRKPYADVHPRHNSHKMASSTSPRQHRPERKQRPTSMYAPAAGAGLSVYNEDQQKPKDDGSGTADPKTAEAPAEQTSAKSQQKEEKHHKGLFAFLGLKKSSKPSKSTAPTSPPPAAPLTKSEVSKVVEEKGTEDRKAAAVVGTAATVAVVGAAAAAATSDNDTVHDIERGADGQSSLALPEPESAFEKISSTGPSVASPAKAEDDLEVQEAPARTPRETAEFSDDDMDSAFAKYGGSQEEIESPPLEEAHSLEKKDDLQGKKDDTEEIPSSPDVAVKNPEPGPEAVEVEAEIRRLSVENEPVFSVAVNSAALSTQFEVKDKEMSKTDDGRFDDVDAFGEQEVPVDEEAAFGNPDSTAGGAAFEQGFADAFVPTTQDQDEVFGTEPFNEAVLEDPDVVLKRDNSVFEDEAPTSPVNFSSGEPFGDHRSSQPEEADAAEERIYENVIVSPQGMKSAMNGDEIVSTEGTLDLGMSRETQKQPDSLPIENNGPSKISEKPAETLLEESFPKQEETAGDFEKAKTTGGFTGGAETQLELQVQALGEVPSKLEDTAGATMQEDVYTFANDMQLPAPPNTPDTYLENETIPSKHGMPAENTNKIPTEHIDETSKSEEVYYLDMTIKSDPRDTQDEPADLYEDMEFLSPENDQIKPLEVNLSDDDDVDAQITNQVITSSAAEAAILNPSEKVDTQNEFPKPDAHSTTLNGDSAAIQPIYEEPPLEDPPANSSPLPNKSPTKSLDSQKYLDLPPNYLFSAQALYQYRSSDEDELSFDKGDVIHIVVHPDPEEQDEGWQMGVRQIDWEEKSDLESCMGVFPENFTKRIQL